MAKTLKRGRLSKAEEYYIQGNRLSKTPSQIAEELGRSTSVVKKAIDNLPVVDITQAPPDAVEHKEEQEGILNVPKPGEEARETIAKIYDGVNMKQAVRRARVKHKGKTTGIVMTEEISGKSDSITGLRGKSRMTEGAIFKPHGEDE